jgi:guanylate kinase
MIILVGCSAAGKSSIEKELVAKGYKNIVSYTSRPIREKETNHKDYHFITKEEFETKKKEGFFAENTIYNGWYYGIAKSDMKGDAIVVVEPYGFRQIKKLSEKNKSILISFFIDCPERTRLKRMVDRGDNLMEVFRRIFSDQGVFQGICDEVTYIINNDRPIDQTVEEIIGYLS